MDMRSVKNVLVDQSVDGIWAHASLYHLPKKDALEVLKGLYIAVKVGGVLYLSLKIGMEDQVGVNGEVVKVDERYAQVDENGTPCKLYSYYTIEEVKTLLANSGWEVIEIGEDDRRGSSNYATHSMLYVFATRGKE
jgi:predicted SAM-dependent methyltransferase